MSSRTDFRLVRAGGHVKAPLPRPRPVRVVVATQLDPARFRADSLLGRSLATVPPSLSPTLTVHSGNTGADAQGLPALYNRALDAAEPGEILVCLHDDVHLHDWNIVARAREAVTAFDVAGIAGAREPDLGQPAWYLTFDEVDGEFVRGPKQAGRHSGSVSHGAPDTVRVEVFGPAPQPCELLDGVVLVLDADRVKAAGARFDERFRFHFYDLDFCRTARARRLAVGTWPIGITHGSRGAFDSAAFAEQARRYLAKWSS